MRTSRTFAAAAFAAMLAVGPALSQTADTAEDADPSMASPFAFAEKHSKEELVDKSSTDSGSRVVGGELAAPGAWPWQVALVIASQPLGPDAQFCGGSLILDRWVLTAAHCIYISNGKGQYGMIRPEAIRVVAGTNKLAPGSGDAIEVATIIRHADYNPQTFDNDIALIKLARPPQVKVGTVRVPDAAAGDVLEQAGIRATVTGWGLTEDGSHPGDLLQAQIEMLPRDACNQALLEARAQVAAKGFAQAAKVFDVPNDKAQEVWRQLVSVAHVPLTSNMVCSGTYQGGRGACSGDSGGPLVVALKDGSYIQAGVVSWGLSDANTKSCNTRAKFSAYTRVANYLDWLKQTIAANQ